MKPVRLPYLLFLLSLQLALPACGDGDSPSAADRGSGSGGGGGDRTDGGASGFGLADCEPIDPSLADADAGELFDYPDVPTFDFYLPEGDWEALQANALAEEYTEAELCFEGKFVGVVGLRFKGSVGSLQDCFDDRGEMTCPRLSMKVKFDEYDTEQRLFGLKRLNFNAYRYDDSRMKENLTYDLFRAMGIVAPRASWAVLRVNGEQRGLYGMVEQVDGRFTDDRWPDHPDGNLYKEVWPTLATPVRALNGLRTNEDAADVDAYVAFAEALEAAADDDEVLSLLDEYLGLDYLARYMAVDDVTACYDGVTYFWTDGVDTTNHNYYMYEEGPEQFTLVPWDVETSFWINPDHAAPHWTEIPEDCSETYPYWDGLARAPGCDRIFRAMASDLAGWRAAGQELMDGPFSIEAMEERIERYRDYMGDEARADPTPTVYGTFDGSVDYTRSVLPDLRDRFERLMAGQY